MNFRTTARFSGATLVGVWLLSLAGVAKADVQVASLFTSHMVLQRNAKIPVWGTAQPGEKIVVAVGPRSARTTTDAHGNWRVKLGSLAGPGPYTMTVSGKNIVVMDDVLIGEVWVCSGQSNMQWALSNTNNKEQEIAESNYPAIRLFSVPLKTAEHPQKAVEGSWKLCDPTTSAPFSAVAYFFGRELHKTLKVPVGLINTSWGGTQAEAWTPREALATEVPLRSYMTQWDNNMAQFFADEKAYPDKLAAWEKEVQAAKEAGLAEPAKPKAPANPWRNSSPAALYNSMIAPLVPYAIKGVIWYQGESNAARANQYRTLFPTMIKSWRTNWKQGDFPFLYVQLANYMKREEQPAASTWAELREAQDQALKLKRTGVAVTIDIGLERDIHPRNKQDVGKRLALVALAKEYRQNIEYAGPTYKAMKIEGKTIRLKFSHAEGLKTTDNKPLLGFAIAGIDQKFVWAKARIEGDSVVVSSEKVLKPVAVRYAWANNPATNFYNAAGLPASPFRTDNWPGITK